MNRPVDPDITWCDCGQPATHRVNVRCGVRGGYLITLDLCESCWQIEKGFGYENTE